MPNKLETLLRVYGVDIETLLEESLFGPSAGVPAICCNGNCEATYEYEPDCHDGWCDECNTNSVKSALDLAGMI